MFSFKVMVAQSCKNLPLSLWHANSLNFGKYPSTHNFRTDYGIVLKFSGLCFLQELSVFQIWNNSEMIHWNFLKICWFCVEWLFYYLLKKFSHFILPRQLTWSVVLNIIIPVSWEPFSPLFLIISLHQKINNMSLEIINYRLHATLVNTK